MKIRFSLFVGLLFIALMSLQAQEGGDYAHSNDTDPDYTIVFPQDAVNTMTISIAPENWQAMWDDMTEHFGEFGSRPATTNLLEREENPIWVPATIHFEDEEWPYVAIRFKGSSSLVNSWGNGNYKLPFKLDFDEFEDTYPEIENQRFYGFQQLSFSNNWMDSSFLREKVTADIFREAGVVSAQTAFYAVYVDYGEGAIYFGLYTAVEVIDDTVIETQFSDDEGNLYKPEGEGASFAEGTFNEEDFEKETNSSEADFSDVRALYDALHAETRLNDPTTWRGNLETVFNVDAFMRWLAVNTVVQNWDTYGRRPHNYYLYNDPTTGQLTWIPWDNNLALQFGLSPADANLMSIDQSGINAEWPLIRYLMDEPEYSTFYRSYVEETINSAFEPGHMEAIYTSYHELITPYVVGENGEIPNHGFLTSPEAFNESLPQLINHVNERYQVATDWLATQP